MDEGKGEHDETSDPVDHSRRNKADDAFFAEEDDELLPINKASGVINNEVEDKKPPPSPPPPLSSVQNAGTVSLPGAGDIGQKQPFLGVRRGSTAFFLGNLHWWTTDSDVESELCKYGKVREVRYFSYEDNGKSKGYCRVEFYDPLAAAACKKGLVGHEFNGRPCVVSSRAPFLYTNQPDEVEAIKPGEGNGGRGGVIRGGGGDNRGYGRGNWGRGNNLGMRSRGHGNPMRNRGGGMGGRSIRMGGAAPRMMMRPRMDPIGRMGGYAGFPGGPIHPFPGNLPSYPSVGLHGLAPYPDHSFYGRGMHMHDMAMIPPLGMYGPNMGMWPGPDMGRWDGDEHGGGKFAESGYGEEAQSDNQYNEVDHDRGDDSRARSRDHARDRERGRDLDRHREDRDKYADQSRKYSHNGKRRQFNL